MRKFTLILLIMMFSLNTQGFDRKKRKKAKEQAKREEAKRKQREDKRIAEEKKRAERKEAARHKRFAKNPVWIWKAKAGPNQLVYFRKDFENKDLHERAWGNIQFTCDDKCRVWVNDKEVGSVENIKKPARINISKYLRNGRNKIFVEAMDKGGDHAGFVARIDIRSGKQKMYIKTDTEWKVTSRTGRSLGEKPEFKAYLGEKPWGNPLYKPKETVKDKKDKKEQENAPAGEPEDKKEAEKEPEKKKPNHNGRDYD